MRPPAPSYFLYMERRTRPTARMQLVRRCRDIVRAWRLAGLQVPPERLWPW